MGIPVNTEALKAIRSRSGLNQSQLAIKAGLRQPAYNRIESGNRQATEAQARAIAMALHVPITAILRGEQ